jgi:hypothetical protein
VRRAVEDHGGLVLDSHGVGPVFRFVEPGKASDAGPRMARDVPWLGIGLSFGQVDDTYGIGTAVIEAARLLKQARSLRR